MYWDVISCTKLISSLTWFSDFQLCKSSGFDCQTELYNYCRFVICIIHIISVLHGIGGIIHWGCQAWAPVLPWLCSVDWWFRLWKNVHFCNHLSCDLTSDLTLNSWNICLPWSKYLFAHLWFPLSQGCWIVVSLAINTLNRPLLWDV